MRVPAKQWFATVLLLMTAGTVSSALANSTPNEHAQARQQYVAALAALKRGQSSTFQQLRSTLDDYPLAIYLDYAQLNRRLNNVTPAQANEFLQRSANSPLHIRFLSGYLKRAGQQRRWQDLLHVMSREPNSIELKCYYFRAQLAKGDKALAWAGAASLWVHGKSQPKACDPLFAAWMKAGKLSDDIVWTRMLNAFDAREGSLLRYVGRQGSPSLAPWSDSLQAVYLHPERLRQVNLPPEHAYSADIAAHGLAYLARYSPEKALAQWLDLQSSLSFSDLQTVQVESAIVLRALFAKVESMQPWLHDALARLQDDKLVEIRLRWALAEQNWDDIASTLALLSSTQREESAWRYWHAMVVQHNGDDATAQRLLEGLAQERGYYSFLAADKLGLEYQLNHQVLEAGESIPLLLAGPAVARIEELVFHEQLTDAHSEWFKVLNDAEQPLRLQQLAVLAAQKDWHRMAIDAANRAKAWDALDLRFPTPYKATFISHAAAAKVPGTELMAIARRESAFFAQARSPVGARGLMQIMPATGKQVASSIGKAHSNADLYEVEHNVLLGSTYYRQLLDRFGGNRVFALTAYNAGPHRVDRWRNSGTDAVPLEVWVETIPFKETRNYVQAVLAYNVVFQYMIGDTQNFLTPLERQAQY